MTHQQHIDEFRRTALARAKAASTLLRNAFDTCDPFTALETYLKHGLPIKATIQLNERLIELGHTPPGWSVPKWEILAIGYGLSRWRSIPEQYAIVKAVEAFADRELASDRRRGHGKRVGPVVNVLGHDLQLTLRQAEILEALIRSHPHGMPTSSLRDRLGLPSEDGVRVYLSRLRNALFDATQSLPVAVNVKTAGGQVRAICSPKNSRTC